jgi:L-lactate dehydrogenase complex protein LldG
VARGLEAVGASDRRVRIADLGHADLPWGDAGLDAIAGAATPDDAVGLSQGLAGIAETGTVLLVSAPGNPTTLAFLPETHVVVLDRDAVVGTFEDAIAILRASCGGRGLPRTVNFISGASRTGDIGGRIVAGAHGPRRLVILLLHNGQGAPRAP